MELRLQLILISGLLSATVAYTGPDLPPGPYCGSNNMCCRDRLDSCSHRILDTLCYCDEFCNRTRAHDDCCPDYAAVCLGELPPPEPAKYPCKFGGKIYVPGEKRQDNCNTCECVETSENQSPEWRCEQDVCIINGEVIHGVNRPGSSWRASNYSEFQGKKLKEGLIYKLGTLPLSKETERMGPIRYDKDIPYPSSFDARTAWPGWITPIRDQGWCGSDWAVTIAAISSDRFAIQSVGAETLELSPQVFLSCNSKGQQGCSGGYIDTAWNFAKDHGLIDEECFPYKASVTRCPFKRYGNLKDDGCHPNVERRTSRFRVGPPGRLKVEKDIMYDIMESGPVHAIMTVYQDFFHYRDGIYRRSHYGDNSLKGLHSVRIIGWGEDNGDKYWIVGNSWGTQWGENGFFRIARGANESGIESFIVSTLMDVLGANSDRK